MSNNETMKETFSKYWKNVKKQPDIVASYNARLSCFAPDVPKWIWPRPFNIFKSLVASELARLNYLAGYNLPGCLGHIMLKTSGWLLFEPIMKKFNNGAWVNMCTNYLWLADIKYHYEHNLDSNVRVTDALEKEGKPFITLLNYLTLSDILHKVIYNQTIENDTSFSHWNQSNRIAEMFAFQLHLYWGDIFDDIKAGIESDTILEPFKNIGCIFTYLNEIQTSLNRLSSLGDAFRILHFAQPKVETDA
jgi:hypothetical protein